jgi:hypothetical protein
LLREGRDGQLREVVGVAADVKIATRRDRTTLNVYPPISAQRAARLSRHESRPDGRAPPRAGRGPGDRPGSVHGGGP